jgi:hypothetical protein
MPMTVNERGQTIATYRFIEVRLMEIAAAWVPTTPEMEVKVLLGKHIWEFAQHADALGRRTFELRLPEQHSQRPSDGFVRLLSETEVIVETPRRLAALYDVILAGMERRYARYIEQTDTLLDAPSVVIVERILQDLARQRHEADQLRRDLGVPAHAPDDSRRQEHGLEAVALLRGES